MRTREPIEIGVSACHSYEQFDEGLVRRRLSELEGLDFDYFEWFRSCWDAWIEYPVLERLNRHKPYRPDQRELLAHAFRELKGRGKRVGLWLRDLWMPANALEVYPELATSRGDIDLSNPLIWQFVEAKLESLLAALPMLDEAVLTLVETPFSVLERFDNREPAEALLQRLLDLYLAACRRHEVGLVLRPFSSSERDYMLIKRSIDRLYPELPVMLKSDAFDWNPWKPVSAFLERYTGRPLIMEVDCTGEFMGRNGVPAVALPYFRERLEKAEQLGARRVTARIDRHSSSGLDRANRLNALYVSRFLRGGEREPRRALRVLTAEEFPRSDAPNLAALFERAFDVVLHLFWVDRQLLFHGVFGDFTRAVNVQIFETLRPCQALDFTAESFSFFPDRVTPSMEEALAEKEQAHAEALALLAAARSAAAAYPALIESFENLSFLTDLYLRLVRAVQAYLRRVDDPGKPALHAEAQALRELADAIDTARGPLWYEGKDGRGLMPQVRDLADGLERTFPIERELRLQLGRAGFEDFILCGFPNEGHRPRKKAHGSSVAFEDGRWRRAISVAMGYTCAVPAGQKRVCAVVRGHGRLTIDGVERLVFRHDGWQEQCVEVPCGNAGLELRFEKLGEPEPCVRLVTVSHGG